MPVKLVNNIPKTITAIKAHSAEALNEAASFGVEEAQSNAPVKTGFLKANIKQTKRATPNNLQAEIRSLASYSVPVNYGTSRQAAQPFWTVAMLSLRDRFPSLFKGGNILGRGGVGKTLKL